MNAGPSAAQQQLAAGAGGGKLKTLVKAHGQMKAVQAAAGQRRVNMDAVKGDGSEEPKVNTALLSTLYNPDTNSCRGILHKKGGSKGGGVLSFQRRNWNKRVFVLNIDIPLEENYTLK